MTRFVLFEFFVTNLLLFEHQQNTGSLANSYLEPYGVTKYGRG